MEQYVSYITLGSSDLSRSCGFYQNCLELPKLNSPPGVHFFSLGDTRLAIWSRDSLASSADLASTGTGFQGFCLSHNVRSHEEVDSLLSRVASGGGTVTRSAHTTDWGGYAGYFTDPDGFLWEVVYNPKFFQA
jgi:catechol 2,3-dioxygenase-like lactoylglutathione lyase family enzyme